MASVDRLPTGSLDVRERVSCVARIGTRVPAPFRRHVRPRDSARCRRPRIVPDDGRSRGCSDQRNGQGCAAAYCLGPWEHERGWERDRARHVPRSDRGRVRSQPAPGGCDAGELHRRRRPHVQQPSGGISSGAALLPSAQQRDEPTSTRAT